MPQRNRDKIFRQSFYDLLKDMNDTLKRVNHAEVSFTEKVGEKETVVTESACIMDCFMRSQEAQERCDGSCDSCIMEWLNSFPF